MARCGFTRVRLWLLEVEMGAVWALAGLSIILFMFASIWEDSQCCLDISRPIMDIGNKVGPKLREFRLLAPSSHRAQCHAT